MNREQAKVLADEVAVKLAALMNVELTTGQARVLKTEPHVFVTPAQWGYGAEWRVKVTSRNSAGQEFSSVRKVWSEKAVEDAAEQLAKFVAESAEQAREAEQREALRAEAEDLIRSLTDGEGNRVYALAGSEIRIIPRLSFDNGATEVEFTVRLAVGTDEQKDRLRRIAMTLADERVLMPDILLSTYVKHIKRMVERYGIETIALALGSSTADAVQALDRMEDASEMGKVLWNGLTGYGPSRVLGVTRNELHADLLETHREVLDATMG